MKDNIIARVIANWADPERCRRNRLHVGVQIALTVIQFLLVIVLVLGTQFSHDGSLDTFTVGFIVCLGLLGLCFIWGFATNRAGAYRAYITLAILGLGNQVLKFPNAGSDWTVPVGIVVSIALIAYAWFICYRLFPDLVGFRPRRVGGQYVFVERA